VQGYFAQNFSNLPEKHLRDSVSSYKFSVAVGGISYFLLPIDIKTENVIHENLVIELSN